MVKSLTVLGSASQQPTRYRSHNAYFLNWDCHQATPAGILFDCGENSQQRMIFADISCSQISAICLTHLHGDHCLGLPGIIQGIVNATKDFDKTIELYYPAASQKFIDNLRNCCAYKMQKLKIVEVPIKEDGVVFENKYFTIEAMFIKHRMPTVGYRVEEKPKRNMLPEKLKAAGIFKENIRALSTDGRVTIDGKTFYLDDFSVMKPGKVFAFVMDTSPCANAVRLAQNADLFLCESTYLSSEEEDALKNGHMTARQAAETAVLAKSKKLVLTHFSQRYPNYLDFENEARLIFENVVAAKDGFTQSTDQKASQLIPPEIFSIGD